MIWDKTFGEEGVGSANSVITTNDNGYAIAGYTFSKSAGGYNLLIMKLDQQGNKIWDKTFGGDDFDIANSLIQTTDGGYAVAGTTVTKGAVKHDVWLIKMDEQGNLK